MYGLLLIAIRKGDALDSKTRRLER